MIMLDSTQFLGFTDFETDSIPDESQFSGLEIARVPEAGPPEAGFGVEPVRLVARHGILLAFEAAAIEEDHDLTGVIFASSRWVEAVELCLY